MQKEQEKCLEIMFHTNAQIELTLLCKYTFGNAMQTCLLDISFIQTVAVTSR